MPDSCPAPALDEYPAALVDLLTGIVTACRRRLGTAEVSWEVTGVPPAAAAALRRPGGDTDGGQRPGAPVLRVLSVLGHTGLDAVAPLPGPGDVTVVLGSARLLCNGGRNRLGRARSALVESAGLAVALRLPYRVGAVEGVGLWILVGSTVPEPMVSDLGSFHEGIDPADVVAEIGAVLTGADRPLRWLCPSSSTLMAAGLASVVPAGRRPPRRCDISTSRRLSEVEKLLALLDRPLPETAVTAVPTDPTVPTQRQALSQQSASSLWQVRSGVPVDPADHDPTGTVRVIGIDPDAGEIRLTDDVARTRYGRAPRVMGGDIIFVESPPTARILERGTGGIIPDPVKMLRMSTHTGMGPRAMVEFINRLPADMTTWRQWTVPTLTEPQRSQLEETVAAVERQREDLRARLAATERLLDVIVDAVDAHALNFRGPES